MLILELQDCLDFAKNIFVGVWTGAQMEMQEYSPESCAEAIEIDVPKSRFVVASYVDIPNCEELDGELLIPQGMQCDSIYAFCDTISTVNESERVRVKMHKQFATIFLDATNIYNRDKDFSLRVKGESKGLDLLNLKPVTGAFDYLLPKTEGVNIHSFRVPRQKDDTLLLELISGDEIVNTLELGKLIAESGYDWNMQDLEDIYLVLSGWDMKVDINISDWKEQGEGSITM